MPEESNKDDTSKTKRDRSPEFPYIGLTRAIERTGQLLDKAKRYEVRVSDAASAWKMSPKSSASLQTVAALIAFGLIEDSGSGSQRKVRVSEMGERIWGDSRPGVKDAALAAAALRPPLIAEMARAWNGGRPDDAMCISELKFDRGFTDDGARAFLRVFDDTIKFAGYAEGDKKSDEQSSGALDSQCEADSADNQASAVKVGDYVQWTNNGIDQFRIPTRVTWISEDGQWLGVEDSNTGIPANEVQLQGVSPPVTLALGSIGSKGLPPQSTENDIKVLLDGDRLRITASVDLRGARKLMRVLKANMALLEDDGDENDA